MVAATILDFSSLVNLEHSVMLIELELYIKFGLNICYSHWDQHTCAPDVHLMTSRELASGFDFWSCGPLRLAALHLSIKFGADVYIQSRVIDISLKFKMAAAAILDFQFMWIWPFRRVDSVVFVFCTKFVSNICYSHWDRRTFRPSIHDLTRINFRFRLLVTWSSLHGGDAWCIFPWNLVQISLSNAE